MNAREERLTGAPDKVLDRIRKLLRLARDARGNENEAANAADAAARLMSEHGLSVATIEASGGVAEGRTEKAEGGVAKGRAPWMPELMRAVAEASFCLCEVDFVTPEGDRQLRMVFRMFGRESAVAGAFALGDYLRDVVWRLSRDAERPHYFRMGCAERLTERVRENYRVELGKQRERAERESREQAARAAHPSATAAGNLPAVILEDYAQSERDGNEDLRRGLPAGTTAAEQALQLSEKAARDARYAQLKRDGVDAGVAWNMVYMSMDLERATAYEREWKENQERARAAAEQPRKRTKADEARERQAFHRRLREEARRSDPSWVAGRERGDEVSLARQLQDRKDRKLK